MLDHKLRHMVGIITKSIFHKLVGLLLLYMLSQHQQAAQILRHLWANVVKGLIVPSTIFSLQLPAFSHFLNSFEGST